KQLAATRQTKTDTSGPAPAERSELGAAGMSELRATFLSHADGLPPPPRTHHPVTLLLIGLGMVTYVTGLIVLGVTPGRIFSRLGRLGDIFLLMLPPLPSTMAHFWVYLNALGQTLAIAFV